MKFVHCMSLFFVLAIAKGTFIDIEQESCIARKQLLLANQLLRFATELGKMFSVLQTNLEHEEKSGIFLLITQKFIFILFTKWFFI